MAAQGTPAQTAAPDKSVRGDVPGNFKVLSAGSKPEKPSNQKEEILITPTNIVEPKIKTLGHCLPQGYIILLCQKSSTGEQLQRGSADIQSLLHLQKQ